MNENLLSSQDEEKNMSLVEHLGELRYRVVRAGLGIFVGMCFCWGFSEKLFNLIRKPIEPYLPDGGLVFTAPIDKFMAHIKISLVGGALLSSPFWLYHFWKFVSPALYKNEKRIAAGFVFFGTLQFALGIAFSYFIVLPMAFKFLMTFGGTIDKPMITIDHYLGFFTQTAIIFGLAFEMPVVISFMGLAGIVSQRFLREKRRYAVMVITATSAIAAPPDALSMVLLMVPLWFLYEISIFVVGVFERRKAGHLGN
ncbi:MAG: twin-arginine translocase subunit TatC [Bdellovibrionaceae bacterium]|nr:twin-arginine translocase subunit TatC [Bdellovibrio sp.]